MSAMKIAACVKLHHRAIRLLIVLASSPPSWMHLACRYCAFICERRFGSMHSLLDVNFMHGTCLDCTVAKAGEKFMAMKDLYCALPCGMPLMSAVQCAGWTAGTVNF